MAEPGKPVRSKAPEAEADDGSMRIDAKLVSDLAQLLTDNDLSEIEVADGPRRIKVRRGFAPAPTPETHREAAPPGSQPAAPSAAAPAEDLSGQTIKSPMVGTAFLSPEPGVEPFVSVGDAVTAGDTLLIIEAMKVMNPITAPSGGVIKKILVADAQPVEFDQPLIVLG
ncbi:acetyl-CoA carboxylase biotin carboxyl carrier protein subunit [Sphingomonas sp.]|uniref:acetyl-CoA carboxylase biotin carboxyl carrier protein n=1 Tax=Sphingomonas sp. TaxID=28214 RepID=UPI0025D676F3|nr:acetyl-CoA carboxylase biotin carboxyl carrier protein subunit [Sphingomonas sp.]